MVREQREQNKNITNGFGAFRVLCVFRGQITCLTSVFICVHLWTYFLSTQGDIGESKPGTLPDQVAINTIYRYNMMIALFYDQVS